MANKVTNKEMFAVISSIVSAVGIPEGVETSVTPDEILEWIDNKVEQLNRKATTMTKAQKAKAETDNKIADAILTVLDEATDGMTATMIAKDEALAEFPELSPQKITAVLKKLLAAEKVSKAKIKNKVNYYYGDRASQIAKDVEGEE